MASWPPFFFRAQEIKPARNFSRQPDETGRWHPPKKKGDSRLDKQSGNYGQYWACNGQVVQPIPPQAIPAGAQHFRTVTVYHFDDEYNVVEYDATRYSVGDAATSGAREPWQRMRFHYRPNTSSFATNIGEHNRLFRQRRDQDWARRLLPRGCWADPVENTTDPGVGGMNGFLPLLIALIILSFEPGTERRVLQERFQNGRWLLNPQEQAGRDYRGIVVETWIWPNQSTSASLQNFENGQYGNIFA